MAKKVEENMINAKVECYKVDEQGKKTDELLYSGIYLGTVLELASVQSAIGSSVASFSVGLVKIQDNGVTKFIKLPLEVLDFPK